MQNKNTRKYIRNTSFKNIQENYIKVLEKLKGKYLVKFFYSHRAYSS